MRNKISILKIHLLLFFFLILIFVPRYIFALEVNYPDFLPLQETTTLSELIIVLFRASFVLAGAVAFFSLVYVGFQFIVSGEKPAERQKAAAHIKKVGVGIVILASSVLILQTINPSLVVLTLDDIPLEKLNITSVIPDEPEPAPPGFIAGEDYGEILLAQTLADGAEIIEQLQNELQPLLNSISSLMDECSADLCDPGGGNYSAQVGEEECNCETEEYCESVPVCDESDCWVEEECTEETTCETCPICESTSCTADICVGEPLPALNRSIARNAIAEAPNALNELSTLLEEVQEAQNEVDECLAQSPQRIVLTCPIANNLTGGSALTQNCSPFEDYFCSIRGTSNILGEINIPINDFIESEETLISILEPIIPNIETASCSNTSWECGESSACGSPIGGACGGGTGCPPELFDKLRELEILKNNLEENKEALQELMESAEDVAGLIDFAQGEVILLTCQDARDNYVAYALDEDRYVSGNCLEADVSSCCPSQSTINSVNACENIDLYICS